MPHIYGNNTYISPDLENSDVLLEIDEKKIILFNDDVNTFDDVITWLIDICEHSPEQAEQSAYIVHFNGKCDVKTGSYDFLEPKAKALLHRGLTVEIL